MWNAWPPRCSSGTPMRSICVGASLTFSMSACQHTNECKMLSRFSKNRGIGSRWLWWINGEADQAAMHTHIGVDRWRQKTQLPPGWACRACQKRTRWPWQSPKCQPSGAGATQSPPTCTLKRRPGNSAPISPWLPGTPQPDAQPKIILKGT